MMNQEVGSEALTGGKEIFIYAHANGLTGKQEQRQVFSQVDPTRRKRRTGCGTHLIEYPSRTTPMYVESDTDKYPLQKTF